MSLGSLLQNVQQKSAQDMQNYFANKSYWPEMQRIANDGVSGWRGVAQLGDQGYWNKYPDYNAAEAGQYLGPMIASEQSNTQNLFGMNVPNSTADKWGDAGAKLGKAGMIVGGAIAGGVGLGALGAGTVGATEGGLGAAGAGGLGAADAGVYGLSGIESAAAPGLTGATGANVLAGSAGADTLAGTAAAAGPGEWADLSSWLGADATGAPAYDATEASLNSALTTGAAGGTAGAGATSAGAAGAAAAGGGSALSRLTGGNADMINLAGTLGAAGLGAYGANEQSNRLREIYNDMAAKREPYRQQSLAWLNDPNSYLNGPGAASLDATLRRLSVGGNPISDPTKLGIATQAGLQNWQNAVTGFGNLGLAGEDTRANVASNAAGAANDVYGNIGAGLGALTRPRRTLADYIGGLV